ncbi:hypothetical protein CEP88_01450 [Roseobacter denitrificans]|uniref:Uncharacterized protein n=1 Tax=Roseobacter denitrificans (strain ATCC 33942 / OCh 114) TaxID=375451 RepID=Q167H7_ROSDO|nr:hypothetical protein RD1_2282 [Roseobacter denitrificans OCh 114]AVL51422.1 hypothetical protein CEP88_01450 [Roseobacter denitrificans]SFG42796.1 hypothetical protein SAMN05443635_11744 [Roseobacter denitrificans OCh 114]
MHANRSPKPRSTGRSLRTNPKSPLQKRADHSPVVAHLARIQQMALAGATDVAQLYATETVKGQDGFFVPRMKAAIHCHVGNKMRNPHIKIRGDVYNFGNPQKESRIQDAYEALVGDQRNAALEGYEDCREYLCELLDIKYEPHETADAGAGAAAAGGGSKSKGGGKKRK